MVSKICIIGGIVLITACSSPKPIQYEQTEFERNNASATRDTGDDGDDDDAACLTDGAGKPDTHGFSLAGEQYEGEIADLIANNCAGCHLNTQPRLRDFDEISANLEDIKRTINLDADDNDIMPPSGNMNQDAINAITAWIDAGAPRVAADNGDDEPADDKGDDDKDPADKDAEDKEDDEKGDKATGKTGAKKKTSSCGSSASASKNSDSGSTGGKEWDKSIQRLLDVDKLDECHDDGRAYDRRTSEDNPEGRCDKAEFPANFQCKRSAVEKAFGNSAAIKEALDEAEDEGFEVDYPDQCGNMPEDGRPVVFLVKGVKADDGDPAQLFVRIIRAPE